MPILSLNKLGILLNQFYLPPTPISYNVSPLPSRNLCCSCCSNRSYSSSFGLTNNVYQYNIQTLDLWKQLCLRAERFSQALRLQMFHKFYQTTFELGNTHISSVSPLHLWLASSTGANRLISASKQTGLFRCSAIVLEISIRFFKINKFYASYTPDLSSISCCRWNPILISLQILKINVHYSQY